MKRKLTLTEIIETKSRGEKLAVATAYDYTGALLVEKAEMDIILVGDSLGNVVLGYKDTVPVTMEEMMHHTRAVVRGAPNTLVVVDMPFLSYQISVEEAIRNAGRLLKEGGADTVKLEGGRDVAETVRAVVRAGIPVMGHIGLTPQTAAQLGGFKVQGRTLEAAQGILEDAESLEAAGAYAVVLECIPSELAKLITSRITIPTIGIGAGPECDGQVLVFHDLLGLYDRFTPKFVKRYANLGETALQALKSYRGEVKAGVFPGEEHGFSIEDDVLKRLY